MEVLCKSDCRINLVDNFYWFDGMKKFTGLLAITILLIFSYNGNSPYSSTGRYAGEFHPQKGIVTNKKDIIKNEKDIIIDDDTTILVVSQQLWK